jgi:hypothetical protein
VLIIAGGVPPAQTRGKKMEECTNNELIINKQGQVLAEIEVLSESCWHALTDELISPQSAALAFKGLSRLAQIGLKSDPDRG